MKHRRPRTAAQSSALPSLAALIASGVVVNGCGSSDTPPSRKDRLSTHGDRAAEAFNQHRFGDALHEIGVGLGLLPTTLDPDVRPAGAMPIANPEPRPEVGGAMAPVQPTPPPPPAPPVMVHPSGGAMAVHPQPPPPVESPTHHHR